MKPSESKDKQKQKKMLDAKALIAGDLLKEGEITRVECFRVEMDASLNEDTGPIVFEKNEDFKNDEM